LNPGIEGGKGSGQACSSVGVKEDNSLRYALLLATLVYLLTFGSFLLSPGTLIYLDNVPPLYPEKYFYLIFSEANTAGAVSLASLPYYLLAVPGSKLLTPFLFRELFILLCFLAGAAFLFKSMEGRRLAKYLGILILLYNPFVYLRVSAAGQVGMLIGTALAPVFLYYLFTYYSRPTNLNALKLALAYTLASMLQQHLFILNALIFLLYSLLSALKREAGVREIGTASAAMVLLNLYWLALLPLLKPVALQSITPEHLQFFHPKPSFELNTAAKLAGLYGFWREAAVERIYDEVPVYTFAAFVFLLIYFSVHGFLSAPGSSRNQLFILLIFLGIALAILSPHLELKPFRDSHKFAYLTLLGYTYLIPRGVDAHRRFRLLLPVVVLTLLYFNHMQILLGGQLQPLSYPEEYVHAGEVLDQLEGTAVYFPWRLYMSYTWAMNATPDGRLAVPINSVSRRLVETGCDPGYDFCAETPEQRRVRECVEEESTACLRALGIGYAVVDSCAVAPRGYGWVEGEVMFDEGCLRIVKLGDDDASGAHS